MSEREAIERSPRPRTRASLASDLRAVGLQEGSVALVHSSLSALGWVCGGPVAVIHALLDVLGPGGTLVMPTHSSDYSGPAEWQNPAVTPTRGMGVIAETFRKWSGVVRSNHPAMSFAALGPQAETVTEGHAPEI